MTKPACFRDGMPSGGGTSIQSTWPERSAARRVLASGIGNRITWSTLGMRLGSQYVAFLARVTDWRCTTLVILNGPVPAGPIAATLPQSLPPFSNEVGEVKSM